jgi:hypothetical protein
LKLKSVYFEMHCFLLSEGFLSRLFKSRKRSTSGGGKGLGIVDNYRWQFD